MSLPEQDEVLGPASAQRSRRPTLLLTAVAAIVAVTALASAFMLGRTTATPSDNAAVQAPPGGNQSAGPGAGGGTPPPVTAGQPQLAAPQVAAPPGTANADFLITDRLLAHPPTYEEHQNAPTGTVVCVGDAIRIANTSSRRLGLIDTPDESDASSTLGSVEPGGLFTMVVREPGTFFISAAGVDGLLFRYVAEPCKSRSR